MKCCINARENIAIYPDDFPRFSDHFRRRWAPICQAYAKRKDDFFYLIYAYMRMFEILASRLSKMAQIEKKANECRTFRKFFRVKTAGEEVRRGHD